MATTTTISVSASLQYVGFAVSEAIRKDKNGNIKSVEVRYTNVTSKDTILSILSNEFKKEFSGTVRTKFEKELVDIPEKVKFRLVLKCDAVYTGKEYKAGKCTKVYVEAYALKNPTVQDKADEFATLVTTLARQLTAKRNLMF